MMEEHAYRQWELQRQSDRFRNRLEGAGRIDEAKSRRMGELCDWLRYIGEHADGAKPGDVRYLG